MKDYKRIVFLDIDGVMASIPYLYKGKGFIDPSKCKLLNQLEDIGAEVVISSSWGYDEGRTEKSLRACGLKLPIIGYTDHNVHHNHKWACRGNEIEKWLLENMYENKDGLGTKYGCDYYRENFNERDIDYEYVILDDNNDMLLGQVDNFIPVNSHTGLTKRHINKMRRILTRNIEKKKP